MTDALTTEQIELLRSLPANDEGYRLVEGSEVSVCVALDQAGFAAYDFRSDHGLEREYHRTQAGDVLLATLDTTKPDDGGVAVDLHDKIQTAIGNQQAASHAREVGDRNAEIDFELMRDSALQDALKSATEIATTTPSPNEADSPVFVLKAKDKLTVPTIAHYRALCIEQGLGEQAAEVDAALIEMKEWRAANLDRMKLPDHKHTPHSTPNDNEAEIRADERRRIDELAVSVGDLLPRRRADNYWLIEPDKWAVPGFVAALEETAAQSIQAEAGGPENG